MTAVTTVTAVIAVTRRSCRSLASLIAVCAVIAQSRRVVIAASLARRQRSCSDRRDRCDPAPVSIARSSWTVTQPHPRRSRAQLRPARPQGTQGMVVLTARRCAPLASPPVATTMLVARRGALRHSTSRLRDACVAADNRGMHYGMCTRHAGECMGEQGHTARVCVPVSEHRDAQDPHTRASKGALRVAPSRSESIRVAPSRSESYPRLVKEK